MCLYTCMCMCIPELKRDLTTCLWEWKFEFSTPTVWSRYFAKEEWQGQWGGVPLADERNRKRETLINWNEKIRVTIFCFGKRQVQMLGEPISIEKILIFHFSWVTGLEVVQQFKRGVNNMIHIGINLKTKKMAKMNGYYKKNNHKYISWQLHINLRIFHAFFFMDMQLKCHSVYVQLCVHFNVCMCKCIWSV